MLGTDDKKQTQEILCASTRMMRVRVCMTLRGQAGARSIHPDELDTFQRGAAFFYEAR
jgi:hypothetical protein